MCRNVCLHSRLQQVTVPSSSKKTWIIGVVVIAAVLIVIGVALAIALPLTSSKSNVRAFLLSDSCTSSVLIHL